MDKRFVCTVAAILAVTAGAAVLANRPEPQKETPLYETVSGVEQPGAGPSESPGRAPDYAYLIREHEGRVAVFTADNEEEPEIVYDTLVKYLPDYDQTQLREGIPVKDYPQLVALIEDFVS